MPLTHHLRPGAELGDWMRSAAGDTLRPFAARIASAADRVHPIRPARAELAHYSTVGSIVDARLSLAVQQAPPYAALMGALGMGLMDVRTAGKLVSAWPSHRQVTSEPEAVPFVRPTPSGDWQIAEWSGVQKATPHNGAIGLFDALRRRVVEGTTPGQVGSLEAEAELTPLLATVQGLEQVYRDGTVTAALGAFLATGEVRHDPAILADAVQVITAQSTPLRHAAASGGPEQIGYAAPTFVPAWAEGDLILGPRTGGGSTLVEVKTVTQVPEDRALTWLLQLLAYVLLDRARRWRISRIAVWLPRHGLLLDCPLAEIAELATGMRSPLLTRAVQAIERDGGDTDALAR